MMRSLARLLGLTTERPHHNLRLVVWYDGSVAAEVRLDDLSLMGEVLDIGGRHGDPRVVVKVVEA